ncbi:MAG: bifunctional adenosylcobinamide kinase/adenosylcobinamide-phosphate guanylyltransferase [Clostridia bacterium]|nr:bifunctional adenosylcobinamide kinase/adenosylcobinamide-phosphate guanylyltransferase [Clostridia bacterium]MBQ9011012.1 bifunctional adenosylcobinamide kinase/adenosylcobinamide-phosphate guanylyltransferase [Clostridia bacterium]
MNVLIIGGSGSGKSAYAEKVIHALCPGDKLYLATMICRDRESEIRIQRHREMRSALHFTTVECPTSRFTDPVYRGASALLEDLPNLLANEMFESGDPDRILPDICHLAEICHNLVIVTGNIFSDGITYDASTQSYINRLSQLNQALASLADRAVEVVCGIPVPLRGTLPVSL